MLGEFTVLEAWVSRSCLGNLFNQIKDLEVKVSTVFKRIGVAVAPDYIEACHKLYNNKWAIAKFSKRV